MSHRYRKKPIEIEAIQFTGENKKEVLDFIGYELSEDNEEGKKKSRQYFFDAVGKFIIITLEGDMIADAGDYIIKGVKGEFYPCKPDIFELTYDKL